MLLLIQLLFRMISIQFYIQTRYIFELASGDRDEVWYIMWYIMGIFAADEVEVRGKKAIRLSYKMNMFDRTAKAITLIVQQKLEGYEGYPFTFQYLEET
jgi:hypothetical protein